MTERHKRKSETRPHGGFFSVGEVAQRIGVSKHSLYKWVNAVKPNGDEEQAEELALAKREILKLRADMRRLEEGRDILKKAARYIAKDPGVKYRFILEHRHEFRVLTMCRVLRVHPSGNYQWIQKPLSDRAIEDQRLLTIIRSS